MSTNLWTDGASAFLELQDGSVDYGRHLADFPISQMLLRCCVECFWALLSESMVLQVLDICDSNIYSNLSLLVNLSSCFKNIYRNTCRNYRWMLFSVGLNDNCFCSMTSYVKHTKWKTPTFVGICICCNWWHGIWTAHNEWLIMVLAMFYHYQVHSLPLGISIGVKSKVSQRWYKY